MAELSFDEQWLQSSEQHSAPLEDTSKVTVVDPSTPSGNTVLMSLPGVEFDRDPSLYPSTAKPVRFVQFHLSTLIALYQSLNTTVVDNLSTLDGIKDAAVAATNDAIAATNDAIQATAEADLVDATLEGMTITITGRDGVAKSTNIGFDIYRVYGSVAAMNADAPNVPEGKFVMIATTDPTSPENARLYGKNAEGGFTFLSDLDQASSSAWAEWMETYKPIIIQDHNTAVSDHSTAVTDHTTAATDHSVATQDHTIATQDHSTAVTDHTQAESDTARAAQDHTVAVTDHTTADQDHSIATADHTTATQDHTIAVSDHSVATQDHTRAESDHSTAVQDHSTATTDHEISDAQQSTFEANEAQRQQDFEDAEAERMAAMIVTHCFVDPETMCLMFVTPQKDTTDYQVRYGDLNIIVTY